MIILAVTLVFIVPFYRASAQSSKYYNVTRIAGRDRYETSFFIASQVNPGITNSVILASGKDFPDALAGAPLSKKLNAPILLVDDFIYGNSYENLDYIKKHLSKDGTIYLLGGESSISSNVVNELEQQGYTNIKRLGGENRFDTNGNIIDEMNVDEGTPVVIVNGFNFPDALSISSIAASKGYPIFMSQDDIIPDTTINKISSINPSKVYIIGGTGALSNDIQSQLKNNLSNINDENIIRISGINRYNTSLKIADYFKLDSKDVILANGENFPDALSGSALASELNAPIILTDGKNIDNQKSYIDSLNNSNLIVLGGQGSVSSEVENNFDGIKLDIGGNFQGEKIIDLKTVDINKDGNLENLILTNNIDNDGKVMLYVQNTSSGQIISSKIVGKSFVGYGQIILADITGDGLPEIISMSLDGGSSGSETCDIETMDGNNLTKIDNYNDGEKPGLETGNMSEDNFSYELDGYNIFRMYSNKFNKNCSVDLSNDENMQYARENGMEVQAWMGHGPTYSLYDIDNSGTYGLKVYEDVSGASHADSLGGFNAYYQYEDGNMKLTDLDLNSPYPMTEIK
jgi:putative cell wall-binding protein